MRNLGASKALLPKGARDRGLAKGWAAPAPGVTGCAARRRNRNARRAEPNRDAIVPFSRVSHVIGIKSISSLVSDVA